MKVKGLHKDGQISFAKQLKRIHLYENQEYLMQAWRENWYGEQTKLLGILRTAALRNDTDKLIQTIAQMKAMTDKRYGTLGNMFHIINNRDYDLYHDPDNAYPEAQEKIRNGNYGYGEPKFKSCEQQTVMPTVELTPSTPSIEETNIQTVAEVDEQEECVEDTVQDVQEEVASSTRKTPVYQDERYEAVPVNITKIKDEEIDFEELIKFYVGGMSVEDLSQAYNISDSKVIKLLVTANVYSSDTYDIIKDMRQSGLSDEAIMYRLSYTKKSFNKYVPYTRGIYGLSVPKPNAARIREWRQKQKSFDKSNEDSV